MAGDPGELEEILERLSSDQAGPAGQAAAERIELLRRALELAEEDRLRETLRLALAGELSRRAVAIHREAPEEALRLLEEARGLTEGDGSRRAASPEAQKLRASVESLLGGLYLQRQSGRRADNLERAIASLDAAQAFASPAEEPLRTADLLYDLAIAWAGRLQGNRGENLELALRYGRRAADLLRREEDGPRWASGQFLVGDLYRRRLGGERRENLAEAARHLSAALEEKRLEADPSGWAETRLALDETLRDLEPHEAERLPARRQRGVRRGHERARSEEGTRSGSRRARRGRAPASMGPEPPPGEPGAAEPASEERPRRIDLGPDRDGERRLTRAPPGALDLPAALEEPAAAAPAGAEPDPLAVLAHARASARPARFVNTGFAAPADPGAPLPGDRPLAANAPYLFWLEIGELVAGAVDRQPAPLDLRGLPAEAEIEAVLFAFDGELALAAGADAGALRLQTDGTVRVVRQPGSREEGVGGAPAALADGDLHERRLLFPVRTLERRGPCRLRCNLYHRRQLLQSHRVTAWVGAEPPAGEAALHSDLDFVLDHALAPAAVAALPAYRASFLLNQNEAGTLGIRGWVEGAGGRGIKIESRLGEGAVADLLHDVRGALRRASWGSEEEWDHQPFLYDPDRRPAGGGPDLARLRADLVSFAIRGYRCYTKMMAELRGGRAALDALTERLRTPGFVQLVGKDAGAQPPQILPAAMFYDYLGLDSNAAPPEELTLCPAFLAALRARAPLAEQACFLGDCPSRGEATVVCPSGFWGYRLALGLPASVGEGAGMAAAVRRRGDSEAPLDLTVCVSTDPALVMRPAHERHLQALAQPMEWNYGATRPEILDRLRTTRPDLVYFYCHGGSKGTLPFLEVGPRDHPGYITPDNLFTIHWPGPRPLVFLNGCHTTELSPEKAFQFVSGLVQVSEAAGVIGTEITIFEPLACAFAEDCLRRFLVDRLPIGEAVRRARLALLAEGNPLGLVYIPFVQPALTLAPA